MGQPRTWRRSTAASGIYDTDEQTVAFTADGMEYLREAPGVQTQAIIPAVLSGRLLHSAFDLDQTKFENFLSV